MPRESNIIAIIGSMPERGDQPRHISASDRAALGLALLNARQPVKAYCATDDELAAQYGLAAGAAEICPLEEINAEFDLAIIGLGAVDRSYENLAGIIAERRRATLVVAALDVSIQNDRWALLKDVGRGCREEWTVAGPAVVVVSEDARRPPYVSRHRRRLAMQGLQREPAKMRSEESSLMNVPAWTPSRPRAHAARHAELLTGAADDRMSRAFGIGDASAPELDTNIIKADAETCAQHLLRYLAHHGFLPHHEHAPIHETEPIESQHSKGAKDVARSPSTSKQATQRRPRPMKKKEE